MRSFIRHPTDIPFEYSLGEIAPIKKENLSNISHGGLSFQSKSCFDVGSSIFIRIPLRNPPFEAEGTIVWCKKNGVQYDIGVEFIDQHTEHAVRMVEQVAYIEHYKREVHDKEGRSLSGEEAAFEWINKYASNFPD